MFSCSDINKKSDSNISNEQIIDTLKYSSNSPNINLKLELLSDGRFIYKIADFGCIGGGEIKTFFGRYKMDSLYLNLIPENIEYSKYSEKIELKPDITLLKYGIDSLKIKTDFKIITWENNKYLLSEFYDFEWNAQKENDYIRFADYLNSGLEPQFSGMYLTKKTEDTIRTEFDLNKIPEQWQSYFLKEPLSVKIKNIKKISDEDNNTWQIELDKGYKDQITDRITFTTQNGEFFINVDSVLKNRSFGITHIYDFSPDKYPIGTELKTKWE